MTGPGTYTGIALGGPLAGQSITSDLPIHQLPVSRPLAKAVPEIEEVSAFIYVYRTGVRTTHGIGADFWVPKEHAEDPAWWVRELVGGYRAGVGSGSVLTRMNEAFVQQHMAWMADRPDADRQNELAEGIAHERKRTGAAV